MLKVKVDSDTCFTCWNTGSRNESVMKCQLVLFKTFLYSDLNHPLHLNLPFGLTLSMLFFPPNPMVLQICLGFMVGLFFLKANKFWFCHRRQHKRKKNLGISTFFLDCYSESHKTFYYTVMLTNLEIIHFWLSSGLSWATFQMR